MTSSTSAISPPGDLPRLVVVTDRHVAAAAGHRLDDAVAAALDAGAPAVIGRDKDLPDGERARLLAPIAERTRRAGARFLVASDVGLARELAADGVHLAAADPPQDPSRVGLVGRSTHDVAEVAAARAQAATYVTVSPVAPSTTKPGHGPPLGRAGVAELVAAADGMPVLALGGVTPDLVDDLLDLGVHGIAVLGGVLAAADPAAATTRYLERLERAR